MSRTPTSATRKSQATREAILDATRGLLEERGGQPWSVDEVAGRAGVTRMTVYRQFGSRTHLLLATARHVDAEENAAGRFAVLASAPSGPEALAQWVDLWVGYVPRIHRLAQALLAARATDPAAAAAWADRMAFFRDGCRRIVARLHAEGVLAAGLDLETGADLMWALASVQVWDALIDERDWSVDRYRTQLQRVMASALLDNPFGPLAG